MSYSILSAETLELVGGIFASIVASNCLDCPNIYFTDVVTCSVFHHTCKLLEFAENFIFTLEETHGHIPRVIVCEGQHVSTAPNRVYLHRAAYICVNQFKSK